MDAQNYQNQEIREVTALSANRREEPVEEADSRGVGAKNAKVALYARVSKRLEQNPENQLIPLRQWAENNGYEVEGEYVDEISSRDTRPAKEELLKKLRRKDIDGVGFWSLDRWGRNIVELIMEMEEFADGDLVIFSYQEALDLSTASGRLAANLMAAMANFERDRIRERTMLGLARARAQGKKLGRPRKNRG